MALPLPPNSSSENTVANVGGHTHRQLETTAWAETNRMSLNIVKDSIEQTFTQSNPRYTTGYLGGFGYKSTASNPLLDHTIENVRVPQNFGNVPDESWHQAYDEQFNNLPPEMQQALLSQEKIPYDSRNPNLVGLKNLLETSAKTTTQLQNLAQPSIEGSLEAARTTYSLLMPIAALKGSLANSAEMSDGIQKFLERVGASYRDFDAINNLTQQMQSAMGHLGSVNSSLASSKGGELTDAAKVQAGIAGKELQTLSSKFDQMVVGGDMQILKNSINAQAMVAMSLSLTHLGSAPLFLGLIVALTGINSAESKTGVIGPQLSAAIPNLALAILHNSPGVHTLANQQFLSMLITTGLALSSGLASLAVDPGFGLFPRMTPSEVNAARAGTFDAALHLITNSNIVGAFFKEAIAVSGGDKQAQSDGTTLLSALAYQMMIQAGNAQSGRTNDSQLVYEHAAHLQPGVKVAEELSTNNANTTVAIRQLDAALDERDYDGFVNILSGVLPNKELSDFRQNMVNIANTASTKEDVDPTKYVTVS